MEGSEKYLAFEQDLIDKETYKYSTDVFDVLNGFELLMSICPTEKRE